MYDEFLPYEAKYNAILDKIVTELERVGNWNVHNRFRITETQDEFEEVFTIENENGLRRVKVCFVTRTAALQGTQERQGGGDVLVPERRHDFRVQVLLGFHDTEDTTNELNRLWERVYWHFHSDEVTDAFRDMNCAVQVVESSDIGFHEESEYLFNQLIGRITVHEWI